MESTLKEALISLRDSRAELQDIKNEFKIWRSKNPNAQLDSGQGSFLYQELSAARKREETSQKTLQVLLKSMKNFQMLNNSEKLNEGKRKRDNDEVQLKKTETESSNLKKLKSLDESDLKFQNVQEKVGAENDGSSSSSSESDDSDSKSTSSDIASSSSSDSSNSDSSSSESSSDTASESSKSSSDSDEDSKSETHKVKAQPITIPGNLTKAKLKAVRRMKDMPAIHHYFDEDHAETLDKNHIPFKVQPYVKYSETHLYNPKNISLCNSKKKKNQIRQVAEIVDSEEHQTLNDDITPSMVDYDSLDLYSDKRPPPQGSMIVFKRLELSNAYTPELSNWKKGIIEKIDIDFDGSRTRHMVSIHLAGAAENGIEPKVGWEPKFNQLQFGNQTRGKFEIEDENELEDQKKLLVDWSSLLEVKIISN